MKVLGFQSLHMEFKSNFELKEGAIFISDAHANKNKPQFYEFLLNLEKMKNMKNL